MFGLANSARRWLLCIAVLLFLGATPALAQTQGAAPMRPVPPARGAVIVESHEALRKS